MLREPSAYSQASPVSATIDRDGVDCVCYAFAPPPCVSEAIQQSPVVSVIHIHAYAHTYGGAWHEHACMRYHTDIHTYTHIHARPRQTRSAIRSAVQADDVITRLSEANVLRLFLNLQSLVDGWRR